MTPRFEFGAYITPEQFFPGADHRGAAASEPAYFRKKLFTTAVRIRGSFAVETSEGTMRCEDGWLAWDSAGRPYPIADDVFLATYTEVRD